MNRKYFQVGKKDRWAFLFLQRLRTFVFNSSKSWSCLKNSFKLLVNFIQDKVLNNRVDARSAPKEGAKETTLPRSRVTPKHCQKKERIRQSPQELAIAGMTLAATHISGPAVFWGFQPDYRAAYTCKKWQPRRPKQGESQAKFSGQKPRQGQASWVPFLLGNFILSLCYCSLNLALLPTTLSGLPLHSLKQWAQREKKKIL